MKFKDGELIEFSFEFNNLANNRRERVSGYGIVVGVIASAIIKNPPADIYLIEVGEKTKKILKNLDYDYRVLALSETLITPYSSEIKETSKDIQTR